MSSSPGSECVEHRTNHETPGPEDMHGTSGPEGCGGALIIDIGRGLVVV